MSTDSPGVRNLAETLIGTTRAQSKMVLDKASRFPISGTIIRTSPNLQVQPDNGDPILDREELYILDNYIPVRKDRVLLLQLSQQMWAIVGKITNTPAGPPESAVGINAPIVTSLPGSPTDGQAVRFRHTAEQVPWLCIWDTALNGGAGAWAVVGGPDVLSTIGAGFSALTAGITTYTAYTGGPSIVLPAGVWDVVWSGVAQSANASWNVRVRLAVDGVGQTRYVEHYGVTALEGGTRGDPVGQRITLTTTSTVTLQAATNNISGVLSDWQIRATPNELRQ